MHMIIREDSTEARDPNLIKLTDVLFERQKLYIFSPNHATDTIIFSH